MPPPGGCGPPKRERPDPGRGSGTLENTNNSNAARDNRQSRQTQGRRPYVAADDWLEQDAIGSYYAAIAAIGERVRAGAPVPECLLPRRSGAAP